ncbi:MAG: histidinol-phosphate transaminase [Nitrososphaerota archaeon]
MRYRELFNRFEPYTWEPSTEQIAAQFGLKPGDILRLDLNTSPTRPTSALKSLAKRLPEIEVNLYPDTSYTSLREAIAEYTGHEFEGIIPTNGADEAIDIVSRIFLEKGSIAVASVPTYSYFRIASELQGSFFRGVPRLEGFGDDVEGILSNLDSDAGVVWLCSPNNPTGNVTPAQVVEKVCSETEACVVVDEAYYEYSGATAMPLLSRFDNLVIVRTLSKAFGLAAARIGYILASEETVKLINKARPPNSLGTINIKLAMHALKNRSYMRKSVETIISERERVRGELERLEVGKVYPSQANFLLIRIREDLRAEEVHEMLLREGIVLRNLSQNPLTRNCLRATIGLRGHNNRLLRSLGRLLRVLRG